MKTKVKLNFVLTGLFFLLFCLFTYLVMNVDVRPLGPNKSLIGFASINTAIFSKLGENSLMYTITEILGYFALLVALGFGAIGVIQLVHRKSILKVDYSILALGGFYAAVIIFYGIFEVFIVNYRPVLIDGVLEASYPSSHTMLAICIMATAIMQFNERIKSKQTKIIIDIVSVLIIIVIVVGRLMSGVHWFTDIVGAVLLSLSLVMGYYSTVKYIEYRKIQYEIDKEEFMNRHR